MINKNELQTGSIVSFQNNIYILKRNDFQFSDLFNHFNAIPTTQEWLQKFGFQKSDLLKMDSGIYYHPNFNKLSVTIKNGLANEIIIYISENNWKTLAFNIGYVHLFQNKWYQLTKIWLSINQIK